jgi:hypothetical protein
MGFAESDRWAREPETERVGGGLGNMARTMAIWVLLALSGPAAAANWLQLQGNEETGAAPFRLVGFVQPTYTHNDGDPVNGLTGAANIRAYNGQYNVFNLVGPDIERTSQFQILRANLGARGVVPGTGGRINYFALAEGGHNGLTTERAPVFTDLSVTFNYIPHARIRAGLFKTPTGEEALQAVHLMDYIYFTNATDNLLNERFVSPYRTTRPTNVPAGLTAAQLDEPMGAFRDVGVQVYDWMRRGQWEYAYALMVGNGNGVRFNDNDSHLDVTGRLQTSYIFGGQGPKREDVTAYLWHQSGKRTFAGTAYDRIREGGGLKYLRGPFRVGGEYLRGRGMIFNGPNPPFNDLGGSAMEPVMTVGLDSRNRADGWSMDFGWRFLPKWEADFRYDRFNRTTNLASEERRFSTQTYGVQHFFSPRLRLAFNVEVRDVRVTHPEAITAGPLRSNAEAIANSVGNRVAAQLTWVF